MAEQLAELNKGDLEVYSTDEKQIGVWIDGKPRYRKTIDVGAMPNATQKSIAHGITSLGDIISMGGYAKGSTDWIPLPRPDASNPISMWCTTTNIVLASTNNQSSRSGYVTLEYTKQ